MEASTLITTDVLEKGDFEDPTVAEFGEDLMASTHVTTFDPEEDTIDEVVDFDLF